MKKILFLLLVLLSLVPTVLAADQFKPYLHTATVPEAPKLDLYGQYQTNLYSGGATYNYALAVPKGTNNLQPSSVLSYSSQGVSGLPSVVGAGWSLSDNFIQRDLNGTARNLSDDYFILNLEGNQHYLRYNGQNNFSTQIDYYFKIENISFTGNEYGMYWLITKKDGTQYRLGYNISSELAGSSYGVQWKLDQVEDTFGNTMAYSYNESEGVAYLSQIEYNQRKVVLSYENSRPDFRPVYVAGLYQNMTKRLSSVSMLAQDILVRRYQFTYIGLTPAVTSLQNISYFGADNSSTLHTISFEYYAPSNGYWKKTSFLSPQKFLWNNTDVGVRLVDVNNDGFVDMAFGNASGSRPATVYINNRTGWNDSSWSLPWDIVRSGGADNGVRFLDVNNDGFADVLRAWIGERTIYLNNHSGWTYDSHWNITIDFIDGLNQDTGILFEDANNDGYVDILESRSNSKHVYLHNRSGGWVEDTSWFIPLNFTVQGEDNGVRMQDVNGDGLPDLLHAEYSKGFVRAFLHNGSGWAQTDYFQPPTYFSGGSNEDLGVRLVDVNNDGLVDVVSDKDNATNPILYTVWLNNGTGWAKNNSWVFPTNFIDGGKNSGKRIADINGDGVAEIVEAQDIGTTSTWIRNQTYLPILKKVVNEYGGMLIVNYTDSTLSNNSVDGYSTLGFDIKVVSNVTSLNGMDADFAVDNTIQYNYSGGGYDFELREFRGFARVVEQTISAVVTHYFHQDDGRKGKEYRTDVVDGKNFSSSVKGFKATSTNGIFNVTLEFSSSYRYDGNETPFIVNTSYAYDRFGNVITVTSFGDVEVVGDERVMNYTYAMNIKEWILDRVSSSRTYDNNSMKMKETKFYYDNAGLNGVTRGALSKKEDWDSNGNNSFMYFMYDDFGNVKRQTDSLGNSMSYSYDSSHTYPVTVVNALGHVMTYSYDIGTGNLLSEKKNGVETTYVYDTFGRITKEIKPYDSASLPTKKYNYSMDGVAPEMIKVSLKTTANKTNDIWYYYEGFAKLVQLKTDVENNNQIVKNIFYDGLGRVKQEQNPYLSVQNSSLSAVSATENYAFYTYDALDRVIGVVNPDGTTKNITFDRRNITDFDENRNRHTYTIDGFDRITHVYEFMQDQYIGQNETYVTSYTYDANDNLIRINDSQGNQFVFVYDSMNRKVQMNDPDLGTWQYKYDTNGNLVTQNDSRGQKITLTYDELNRIKTKTSSNMTITFGYDKDLQGTLSNESRVDSDTATTIVFAYEHDDRLRMIKETQTTGGVNREIAYQYDSQDRLVTEEGQAGNFDYIFNKQGRVKQLPNFVTSASFNAHGSVLNRTYNNNLLQTFTYNSSNNRLYTISIPNVQSMTYTYDKVGNIVTINDAINNRFHNMSYDSLDRLTRSVIGTDRFSYNYDSIGRIQKIVKNNESKKFVYNGSQTHAPSKIIEGSAGIDIYHINDTATGTKNRTIEFFLVNDKDITLTGISWTANFGDGSSTSGSGISLGPYSSTKITTSRTYAVGGKYLITVTATSANVSDAEVKTIRFGTRAAGLRKTANTAANYTFEFEIRNDINDTINNTAWNCTNGVFSSANLSLTGNTSQFVNPQINFTSPGTKNLTCTAYSSEGIESKGMLIDVQGFEPEDYDVLSENTSTKVIAFNAKNNYFNTTTNISVVSDNTNFSKIANINKDAFVMVISEVEYSSDGTKTYTITLDSGASNQKTKSVPRKLEGVAIENYTRIDNGTQQHYTFYVRNKWESGNVTLTLTDPSYSNTSSIPYNNTLKYNINHNYTTQGTKNVIVTAQISSFTDRVTDNFEIRPLKIDKLNTLAEAQGTSVTELVVRNNANYTQYFSWIFNSGTQNLSSNQPVNLTTNNIFVYIASNYSTSGVFRTNAMINSSTYRDNETGVIVT